MLDKIKAFLNNRVVMIIEAVIIALASAGLILGGVSADDVAKLPALALGIITAVVALITFIKSFIEKK